VGQQEKDAKAASIIHSAIRWIAPIVSAALVVAGGYYNMSEKIMLMDERSDINKGRIQKLEDDVAARTLFGPNGFSDGRIRSAIDNTIRAETKHLLPRDEFERRILQLVERNSLKP